MRPNSCCSMLWFQLYTELGEGQRSSGRFRRIPAAADIQLVPVSHTSDPQPQLTGDITPSVTVEHHLQSTAGGSPHDGRGFLNRGYPSGPGLQYPMAVVRPTVSDAARSATERRPVAAGRRKSRGSPPLQVRKQGDVYREQTTLI